MTFVFALCMHHSYASTLIFLSFCIILLFLCLAMLLKLFGCFIISLFDLCKLLCSSFGFTCFKVFLFDMLCRCNSFAFYVIFFVLMIFFLLFFPFILFIYLFLHCLLLWKRFILKVLQKKNLKFWRILYLLQVLLLFSC